MKRFDPVVNCVLPPAVPKREAVVFVLKPILQLPPQLAMKFPVLEFVANALMKKSVPAIIFQSAGLLINMFPLIEILPFGAAICQGSEEV